MNSDISGVRIPRPHPLKRKQAIKTKLEIDNLDEKGLSDCFMDFSPDATELSIIYIKMS